MRRANEWKNVEQDPDVAHRLAAAMDLHPVTARILAGRGYTSPETAKAFLESSAESLRDPFELDDMPAAAERIVRAAEGGEKIVFYGDYDVDGITGTSIYLDYFRRAGIDVDYYIPPRLEEGYGLNIAAIRRLADSGVRVLVTADNGTTAVREIALAHSLGIDVIVTDHHEVPPVLPDACAIVNPNRPDSVYPFKGLCGAALAYKLTRAVHESWRILGRPVGGNRPSPEDYLDLVTLGTIADVSPILGENRYLVRTGLALLSEGRRPGIQALKEVARVNGAEVTTGTVGFTLAPRINAGGRLATANEAVRLLTTDSLEEARTLARYLDERNRERQLIEAEMSMEAREMIEREVDLRTAKAIVLASPRWHSGVIGIVASRIVEQYYLPAVVISIRPDGMGKGSARSIPPLHLYDGLSRCRGLLEAFGGHKYAAGLTLKAENIPAFRDYFQEVVGEMLSSDDFRPKLRIDASVEPEEVSRRLLRELDTLGPFGVGNPEPTLSLFGVRPHSPKIVGNNHLKMRVSRGPHSFDVIGFRMGHLYSQGIVDGRPLDLAFTPKIDRWPAVGGEERLQLRLKDLRAAEA